jgi:hypothetical protein
VVTRGVHLDDGRPFVCKFNPHYHPQYILWVFPAARLLDTMLEKVQLKQTDDKGDNYYGTD